MTKSVRHLSFALVLLALAAAAVVAQDKSDKKVDKKSDASMQCRENRDSDRHDEDGQGDHPGYIKVNPR